MKEKIIALVYEKEDSIIIKKLLPFPKLVDNNYRLETKVYDTENQIWYKLSLEKC